MPWLVHRVATSRRYNDSLADIMERWGLDDVITANEVLDAYDDARARAEDERRRERGHAR